MIPQIINLQIKEINKSKNINEINETNKFNEINKINNKNSLINANNDMEACAIWLNNFSGNTKQSYHKEAERFLLWLQHKPLNQIKAEDIQAYIQFCQNPDANWCMQAKYPRNHPNWRPWTGGLSPSSLQQAIKILKNLFNWLLQANYLNQNPFLLIKQKSKTRTFGQKRSIPEHLWQIILQKMQQQIDKSIESFENLKNLKGIEKQNINKNLKQLKQLKTHIYEDWLLTLFYLTGMRAAEALSTNMDAFSYEYNATPEQTKIWLHIIGKGNKPRDLPVSIYFLEKLARYRVYILGLEPLPKNLQTLSLHFAQLRAENINININPNFNINNDLKNINNINIEADICLISHIKKGVINRPHRTALHQSIKKIFHKMHEQIINDAAHFEVHGHCDILLKASTHWVRHTTWTHMVNQKIDLRIVRDNAGHASIATTNIYLHTEDDERHQATLAFQNQQKKILDTNE